MDNMNTLELAKAAVRHYAETHPRPPHVTQRQAAEMLGVSPPTVYRLVRAGKLRLNGVGLIPIGEVDAVIAANESAQQSAA